nr:Nitrogen regulatory protein P-II [uncultured bacterium]
MKVITAIIQPFRLSKVTYALEEIKDFPGITVTDVRGFGREKSAHEEGAPHRVIEDFVEYVKKVRIEIVARDEMVEQIVETIRRVAHTGNRGDGKIFVWPVEQALRIQTGDMNEAAV